MKKLLLLSFLLFSTPCYATSIALDTTTAGTGTTGTTQTLSITIAANSNRILIYKAVAYSCSSPSRTVSSVAWNGSEALTKAVGVTRDVGGGCGILTDIWYLIAPTSGAHNLVATFSGNMDGQYGDVTSAYNAKQSAQPDATNSASLNSPSNPFSTSITTVANNAMIFDAVNGSGLSITTPSAGQTTITSTQTSYKEVVSPGSSSMGWSYTSAGQATHALASFAPVASSNTSGGFFGE